MQKEFLKRLVSGPNRNQYRHQFRPRVCSCCNIVAIALALFVAGIAVAQSPSPSPSPGSIQDVRDLKFGETIQRTGTTLAQPHIYQFTLEAGTSVECNLGHRDISVLVTVGIPKNDTSAPGDKGPGTVDAGQIIFGFVDGLVNPIVIVSDRSGKYTIRTGVRGAVTGFGKYSITCGQPHATTDRDRKYLEAERLTMKVGAWFSGGGNRSYTGVSEEILRQAEIYRSLDDKKSLSLSLMGVCFLYRDTGELGKAIENCREARALFTSLNSPPDLMWSLTTLRDIALQQGDYQEAIERETEKLTISRTLGSKQREASALLGLGVIYHRLADEQKARDYYEQFFAINRAVNPPTVASLNAQVLYFTNMANLYRGMDGGEIPVDAFAPRTNDDYRKALEYLQQSLEINRKMEALFAKSADLYTFNLLQIGNTYKELGQYSEALEYLNRYEATRRTNDKRARARVAILLGSVYARKGDMGKASDYFNEVIGLLREGANDGNQTGYLHNIARDYSYAGDPQKALDVLQEAIVIDRAREDTINAASSLFEIARIERDLGNFDIARKNVEEAIQIAESVRARITADELRTTYFSSVKRYYDFYIDLLMQAHKSQPEKGFDALALQTSEKRRSRSLLDLLTLSGIDIKQGVDAALLEREKTARQQLSEKANQQSRLLLAKHTEVEAAKINQEISNLTGVYAVIQTEIRNKSPRYAALTQPKSIDAKQIQQLLDSGTVLLEYSLGEKKSYLWAVTSTSIASFDLPGRDEIEKQARKAYELMTERNRQVKGEKVNQTQARAKIADAEYPGVAAALSEMLLGPAADVIKNKRLVIVPDGALNYISFAALPLPKSQEPNTLALIPLGSYHEVVTLPSASTLARLREETASRKPTAKMVAIFADPVFNQGDIRTGADAKGKPAVVDNKPQNLALSRDFERAVADVGLTEKDTGGLARLPFSRREADSIFSVAPKALSLKDVDFNASKQHVFNSDLDQYRIVHFATHGLLDSQHPELSGIVLSLVDKNGGDVDGFLRLQDIYNLKLNADLVVLSACNTALGKEVKGEGLIGLTRGFMYAGSPRVVASLWKVDDAATAELMSAFYRKMLVENLRPAAALRAAQTEMMKQPRWRSPYYWAPFVLQGEWK